MFETIGSDFHWDDGVKPLVGFVNEEMEFSDEQIESLMQALFAEPKMVEEEDEKIK